MLIRDYGLYDHAMLRFAPGHKLTDNFYVRQDGTRAYYFSQGKIFNSISYIYIVNMSCSVVVHIKSMIHYTINKYTCFNLSQSY